MTAIECDLAAGVAGGAPVVDGEFLLLEAEVVTEPETKASKMTLRTK